jgi:transcriptional regulator with XRE-family HTH domain
MTTQEKIKKVRNEQKLTLADMSDKLNMSIANYKNIESGKIKMTLDRIKEIAAVLKIPVDDLYHAEDEKVVFHNENSFNNQKGGTGVHIGGEIFSKQDVELYERLLIEKDNTIKRQQVEIEFLRNLIKK